jgi:hypothetical protein
MAGEPVRPIGGEGVIAYMLRCDLTLNGGGVIASDVGGMMYGNGVVDM